MRVKGEEGGRKDRGRGHAQEVVIGKSISGCGLI